MKPEPLKGKILLWNQITGDIETTDSKYFLETKTEDAKFFRIFLEKDVKSAIQGLLEDLERAKRVTCDENKKTHLDYCVYLVKKWFADVVEGGNEK